MTHGTSATTSASGDDQGFRFDPSAESFTYDPYPTYAWMREHAPVYHWAERDMFVLTRIEDIRVFFTHDQLSTDALDWEHHPGTALYEQPGFEAFGRMMTNSLFTMSPQDHARVRKLSSVALTPRAVRRMHGSIATIVTTALDNLIAEGKEIVNIRDFAEPIPLAVICDLLGVPLALRADFRSFGVAVIRSVLPTNDQEQLANIAREFTRGVTMLEQVIDERRANPNPPDDLLTDLIQACEDNHRLSNDELLSIIFALIVAGSDTTVHGTCYAVLSLLRNREALAELQADRSLLRGAVEESLRWDSFGKTGVFRYALSDLELAGTKIRKGQAVIAALSSAQRDEQGFADPERFDIRRDQVGSLTFGLGRHFCLGANLARAEIMQAVETLLLDRFPEAELAGPHVIDVDNPLIRAITHLPVRLGPDHNAREASA